jgi:hypothetical protein
MVVSRRRSPEYRGRSQWHQIDIGSNDSPFRNELKWGHTHETDFAGWNAASMCSSRWGFSTRAKFSSWSGRFVCRLKLMRYG